MRPRRSLGQHFLIDGALARRIVELAGVGVGDRVLEIGAGLGSLTVALAATGAEVVAVELDRALEPALREVLAGSGRVRVVVADAMSVRWSELLEWPPGAEPAPWHVVANLPYSVSVPVILRLLEEEPTVRHLLVMVQREVGERLVAAAGDGAYGAVSLHVAYHAEASLVRSVPRSVFWPVPGVDSVLVAMTRLPPPVDVDPRLLWELVGVAFAQRRKTMRNALVRFGLTGAEAASILLETGIAPATRPEELGLDEFARLAEASGRARGTATRETR